MASRTSNEAAALIRAIRAELRRLRNPGKAAPMRALGMYGELVASGAWWDLVDPIATQRLGLLVRRYPRGMATRMRAWSSGRDVWKRRSAILCQIKLKDQTDAGDVLRFVRRHDAQLSGLSKREALKHLG